MNPPTRLRIMGTDWTVKLDRDAVDDGDEWGSCNTRTRTIALHPDGDEPTLLLHEAIHAIEHALAITDLKERHVQGIARGLTCLLRDNPRFRTWLLEQS